MKKGAELTNEYIRKGNIESEDQLKKAVDIIKKEDPVLGEKLSKFYDKSCDLDRLSEEIVKYVLDADKINGTIEKARGALRPLEHRLAESLKKFEVNYCTDLIICILQYFNKFNRLYQWINIINGIISEYRHWTFAKEGKELKNFQTKLQLSKI